MRTKMPADLVSLGDRLAAYDFRNRRIEPITVVRVTPLPGVGAVSVVTSAGSLIMRDDMPVEVEP